MLKIPITKPYFDSEEKKAILEPLESGWVVQGPKVQAFQKLFSQYTGVPYSLATTSGTSALHLALVALDIEHGDEVIIPSFTWVSTANVVEMQGARPVLVDIDPDTFNLDPTMIEDAITPHTRAIMPVSLFGVSAPMVEIMEIARRHGLAVIEDAACATGTWYQNRHAGSLADMGCFSFHARKVISTGEGGMLITSNEKIACRVSSLRDHGASKSDHERDLGARSYLLPEFHEIGFNYRMTDFQGALGVAQMGKLEWILEQRKKLAHRYNEILHQQDWLKPQSILAGSNHSYQSYVCLFRPEQPTVENVRQLHSRRDAWMDLLETKGISTRPGTHAVHLLDFYRKKYGYAPGDFPNSYFADQLTVTLPLYPQMTDAEQKYIIERIKEFTG